MRDSVDSVIAERQALDHGFPRSLLVSGAGHLTLVGALLLAGYLGARKPVLNVVEGFAVALPRGGGGSPNAAPPAPAPARKEQERPKPEAVAQPEPPKILKPPKPEPRRGLPEPDARKSRSKPTPTPPPRRAAGVSGSSRTSPAGVAGGTGTGSQTPGLDIGPPGPGVPGGADGGDFYLASVQRKIWSIWMQQVRTDFEHQVSVAFTILADGSVTGVQVTRSSGASLLDLAAQRAVMTAGPFRPLPKEYGTDRITIQANFKPTP